MAINMNEITVNEVIEKFPEGLIPSAVDKLQKTFQFKISNPVYVIIDNGRCSVHNGVAEKYDVGLTVSDENLLALLDGKLSGVTAFLSGKLKVEGELPLAQRLFSFFDAKKIREALDK